MVCPRRVVAILVAAALTVTVTRSSAEEETRANQAWQRILLSGGGGSSASAGVVAHAALSAHAVYADRGFDKLPKAYMPHLKSPCWKHSAGMNQFGTDFVDVDAVIKPPRRGRTNQSPQRPPRVREDYTAGTVMGAGVGVGRRALAGRQQGLMGLNFVAPEMPYSQAATPMQQRYRQSHITAHYGGTGGMAGARQQHQQYGQQETRDGELATMQRQQLHHQRRRKPKRSRKAFPDHGVLCLPYFFLLGTPKSGTTAL